VGLRGPKLKVKCIRGHNLEEWGEWYEKLYKGRIFRVRRCARCHRARAKAQYAREKASRATGETRWGHIPPVLMERLESE
jgi:hypothetical protein